MPNWCNNYVEFSCSRELYNKYNMGAFQFENLLPCPQELLERSAPNSEDPEEMRAKYGHPDWYDWCVCNWGCKWDIEEATPSLDDSYSSEVVSGSIGFDTAWSPPIELYKFMESVGFQIDAMYFEGGMAFYGFYQDGNEDTQNFSNYEDIPENVATTFGIDEECYEECE